MRVKLIATEGMIYTNGETYGREIFLGTGDSPDNWWEITEDEAKARMELDIPTENRATDADYRSSLREFGVSV